MRHREHFQPPDPIPKTYNTLSVFSVLFGAFLQVPCKVLSEKRPLCRIFSGILSVFQCRYRNFCRQRSGAALGCPMRSGPAKVLKTPFKNLHQNRQNGAEPANCHHFCLTTGKPACKTLQKTYKVIYSRSITSGAHLGGTAELLKLTAGSKGCVAAACAGGGGTRSNAGRNVLYFFYIWINGGVFPWKRIKKR